MNPLIPVLAGWELSDDIIESFTTRYDYLLPFQQKVLKRQDLKQHQSAIIGAPGSAGKTLISEVLALHHILKGNRVIYLLPLKATVEEKYRYFTESYQKYAIKILQCSSDNRKSEADIIQGNYQLAFIIYEKFLQLWSGTNDLVRNTGLIIVDEIQTLGDTSRGANLELLLTLLKCWINKAQILGLCPIPEYSTTIAQWLGNNCITDTARPVPLHEGVLYDGVFQYRDEHQATKEYPIISDKWDDPTDELFASLLAMIESGEQVMVFLKSRRETIDLAQRFAQWGLDLPPAKQSLLKLGATENSVLKYVLQECLEKGIGFHNADLTGEQRIIVEDGFRSGEIWMLVSTTTLAMGVNLPAKNVFIDATRWDESGQLVQIPVAEYRNIAGRAGRLGMEEIGRAILFAKTPFEKELLTERYQRQEIESINSSLNFYNLDDLILKLMAFRPDDIKSMKDLLGNTLSQHLKPQPVEEYKLQEVFDLLVKTGYLEEQHDKYKLSLQGYILVKSGLNIATGNCLLEWLNEWDLESVHPIELFLLAGTCPMKCASTLPLSKSDRISSQLLDILTKMEPYGSIYTKLINKNPAFTTCELQAMKMAILMIHWTEPTPIIEIERRIGFMYGQIKRIAEDVAWVLRSLTKLAPTIGIPYDSLTQILKLSECVQYGIPLEALPLLEVYSYQLSRTSMQQIVTFGFPRIAIEEIITLPGFRDAIPASDYSIIYK